MATWYERYASPPPGLPIADRRFFGVAITTFPLFASVHIVFFFVFAGLGLYNLSLTNLGSLVLWALAILVTKRGRVAAGFAIALFEGLLHMVVATLLLGWESGFYTYIFLAPAAASLLSGRKRVKFALVAGTALVVVATLIQVQRHPPAATVSTATLLILHATNIIGAFGVLGLYSHYYSGVAAALEDALLVEHERSEGLLRNILPEQIATRLKDHEETIADSFAATTILFADIVGFTALSARVSPEDLVQLLNLVFSKIDALADRYGLEKIKTIGDAYMVAAGIPTPRPDHAEAVADFALALLRVIAELALEPGADIKMRIGINTGPVVAGVIGKRKFSYDLWGDSVNTASRLESHGTPGKIHVSAAIYELLKDRYRFEERGEILLKGKGLMRTYFLEEKMDHPSQGQIKTPGQGPGPTILRPPGAEP